MVAPGLNPNLRCRGCRHERREHEAFYHQCYGVRQGLTTLRWLNCTCTRYVEPDDEAPRVIRGDSEVPAT